MIWLGKGRRKATEEMREKQRILVSQISDIIRDTCFSLEEAEIYDEHFGNIIVVLCRRGTEFRFIQDRGDIYVESRPKDSGHPWSDYELPIERSETSLLSAIGYVVSQG